MIADGTDVRLPLLLTKRVLASILLNLFRVKLDKRDKVHVCTFIAAYKQRPYKQPAGDTAFCRYKGMMSGALLISAVC